MKQFKRAKVVMLPTKNEINSLRGYNDRSLLFKYNKEYKITPAEKGFTSNYHLYIIPEDEIKAKDWFFNGEEVLQCSRISDVIIDTNGLWSDFENCKKVIATTDTSLNLPKPSQQFIEKYIEEYNKGEVITDVLVEYHKWITNEYTDETNYTHYEGGLTPKINPKDNTIIIKEVKDSWNREEVIKIAMDCMMYGYNGLPNNLTPMQGMNKWAEENL